MNPSLAEGTRKKPINNTKTDTIEAPIIYGRKNRVNEIPEPKIAMISVLFANLEVNQMIDKNKNIGKRELAK